VLDHSLPTKSVAAPYRNRFFLDAADPHELAPEAPLTGAQRRTRNGRSTWQMVRLPSNTLRESGYARSAAPCRKGVTAVQQTASLIDHLVGELLKVERHVEADRFGGVEIDYEIELC